MNEWQAMSDFLKEHGREEWGEKVAGLTGKVYVLTDGYLDDYRIVGVFSSEAVAMSVPGGDNVNEFIVDDLLEWEKGPIYRASISVGDGEMYHIYQKAHSENRHPTRCVIVEHGEGQDWHRVTVYSPISTAHAMQAAMDRRDQIRGVAR